MSFILASGEAISNSQLNHSCSKQMYSFPKTPRFQSLKRSTSATFIYNIPSMMSQRNAYIGYGHKSDFTKGKDINAYNPCNTSISATCTNFSLSSWGI